MGKTKICSTCKKELNIDNFAKAKANKDGMRGVCRECMKVKRKKYKIDNKESIKEQNRIYTLEHKDELKKYDEKYRLENPEKEKARHKKYCEENVEKRALSKKEYRSIPENREKEYITSKKYKKEHQEQYAIYAHNRRSRKKALLCTFTIEQWEQCKLYFDNKCAYCGKKLPLAQEHFIPVSKGGNYTVSNIICACKSCNSSKYNTEFDIWYPNYKYYSEERKDLILEFIELNKQLAPTA